MQTTSNQDFHIYGDVLRAYTGREEWITVPEEIHTIGEGAFKACVSLKKVILPSQLRHILPDAFKGCRKLEEIQIPAGLQSIGRYAFHRCHALTSIALPPSVEELGDCVFLYCDSLTRAELPGVKHLGRQVFVNDVLLQELTVSPDLDPDCICDVFTGCSRLSGISIFQGQNFRFPNAVEAIAGEMEFPPLVRAITADVLRMMELNGRRLVKFLTNLKHVEIPEGIKEIGKSCFFDKRGILSVSFPSSLTEIEDRAFRNCISLETVRFKNEQVHIHKDAFKNCSFLKNIQTSDGKTYRIEGIIHSSSKTSNDAELPLSLPAQSLVQRIHQQVLGNFRISGTILFQYLGDESRVLVPDGITCIAEDAFAGKESIDRVILPDSLLEIGAGAFRDCLLLQTIPLPSRLYRIGEGAFEHCVKLLRIALPENLTKLETKVFKHCHKLKEIVLGTRVESIGEQAFYGCQSLNEIHFPKTLTAIGEMAFYRCSGLKEICLSPGLEHVGNLAFAQSGIRRAKLCGSGKGYGSDLFFGCLSLRTIILENGVRHIPDKLAYGCTALRQVIFPEKTDTGEWKETGKELHDRQNTITSAGRNVWESTPFLANWIKENLPLKENLPEEIFWDGRNLSGEVYLPESTRIIAGGAFYGNEMLTEAVIPDGVTWIGPAAFKGCTSLRRVVWPAGVQTAEAEVFSGCINLEEVVPHSSMHPSLIDWISVKERAFYHCRSLKKQLLERVQRIEKEAFWGCSSLSSSFPAFFPNGAKQLTWVGERAFEGLTVLGTILLSGQDYAGEVILPEEITIISPYAFSGNRKITRLHLPDRLRHIGEGAFWGCNNLEAVDFPSDLHTVGPRAFEKCASLTELRLCTRQVGARAFSCCTALKTAELTGVSVLEHRLFEHCINLESCSFGQSPWDEGEQTQPCQIGDYCFSGCGKLNRISFASVREIGSYAFQNCDALSSIVLSDHTRLLPHAFEDCGSLGQIRLTGEEGKIHLCAYALSGCTALTQVHYRGKLWVLKTYRDSLSWELPEMVRLIFHSAFSCFAIEQEEILWGYQGLGRIVHIPYGIRRIEAEVFRDVLMLEEVTIPETVEYIGARAFHGTAWMEKQRRRSPMVVVNGMLLDGSGSKGEVTIPQDIRLVCGWAFAGGMDIARINFLSERVRVEAHAFRNCIYLREMQMADQTLVHFQGIADRKTTLPPLAMQAVTDSLNCFKTDEDDRLIECTGNISRLLVAEGITAIGDRVFQDGNLLTEIILPSTVTSIGKFAFSGCKWLKIVKQAQAVTTIGERAFSGCGVLETVELSENLTFIGTRAFENCTSLNTILLPEGLEEIPDRAFFRCHSLKTVVFPSTLKRIGKEAFAFCKNLELPALPAGVLVENRAFAGIPGMDGMDRESS